jgi:hypothetical protein
LKGDQEKYEDPMSGVLAMSDPPGKRRIRPAGGHIFPEGRAAAANPVRPVTFSPSRLPVPPPDVSFGVGDASQDSPAFLDAGVETFAFTFG